MAINRKEAETHMERDKNNEEILYYSYLSLVKTDMNRNINYSPLTVTLDESSKLKLVLHYPQAFMKNNKVSNSN